MGWFDGMQPLNGKTQVTLTIAGVVAALSAMFSAGMAYQTLKQHTADKSVHESAKVKIERIDDRIRLHNRPIEVRLDEIDKKLEKLDTKLDRNLNTGRL